MPPSVMGGIVLCGGRSQRMGTSKHLLPLGEETLLQRVVRIVSSAVGPVVVVAAADQELPELPEAIEVIRDRQPHLGPLSGLAEGLRHLEGRVTGAYLSGCDVPLLRTEFIHDIIIRLGDEDDAVVPYEEQFPHPLAGLYRCRLRSQAEELLTAGELRLRTLLEGCRCRRVPVEELRGSDPDLFSLWNINTSRDYAELLRRTVPSTVGHPPG